MQHFFYLKSVISKIAKNYFRRYNYDKETIFKKATCITLTFLMQLSLLTGCGGTDTSDTKTDESGHTKSSYNESDYSDESTCDTGCETKTSPNTDTEIGADTREYDYEEENPFYSAQKTPYSTFAADVDTASYSNIRGYIQSDTMVPVSAVRIEEMINYFHYDYATPEGNEPFSVNMEIGDCPWNSEHKLVQIGLQTETLDLENAKPSNFVFLIDTSGSMSDSDKLPLVQTAFTQLVENLGENDRISIVTYAGSDQVLLSGAHGDETDKITAALDSLTAYGSTNGSAGINTAYELAEKYFIKGGNNRVILATDGDLNVGITDEGGLTKLIEEKKENNVYFSVLGFGNDNLKDNKLEALADHGNGNYSFIDSVYEAKRVLVNELGATLHTVAKDVKFQAEFNSDVVSEYRLIGYENRTMAAEDFDDDTVDGGEIGAGHRVTVLYEVALTNSSNSILNDSSAKLLDLSIRYKEPDGDESKLLTYALTSDMYSSDASDNMKWASSVAAFGMLLGESDYSGNADYDMVLTLANSTSHSGDPLKNEFISLVESYAKLNIED